MCQQFSIWQHPTCMCPSGVCWEASPNSLSMYQLVIQFTCAAQRYLTWLHHFTGFHLVAFIIVTLLAESLFVHVSVCNLRRILIPFLSQASLSQVKHIFIPQ